MSILLLYVNVGWGQQVIGSFPYMDGGFEGQTATLSGVVMTNTISTTAWSVSSTTNSTVKLLIDDPTVARSGNKYASHTTVDGNRRLQSPSSAIVADAPAASTPYTIQYYYKTTTDNTLSYQAGIYQNTSSPLNSSVKTVTTTYVSGVWTRARVEMTTNSDAALANINFATVRSAVANSYFIDDFAVYQGTIDDVLPDSPTAAQKTITSSTTLNIGWTAPVTGVDGGGYLVVRYAISPNSNNDPNVNGIYAVGNKITNGTAALEGTVVYVGKSTSFVDTVANTSVTYYYKVYTVDKAFNYSNEAQATLGLPQVNKLECITYPNPVNKGKLYINSPSSSEKQVAIYSILGQKMFDSKTTNNVEINVSKLAKGNYILKITEEGKSEAKKLIIQ